MKILQATMHQGDPSFAGHGRQCVANSIMAIIKSKAYNLDKWAEVDVDTVLRDGDRIYQLITSKSKLNSEYLLLNDLPSVLEKNIIEKSKPKAGLVNQCETEGPFHHLEGAFSSLFIEMPNMDGMLLTVGCSTPSYTGAVIRQKQSTTLYFFDPHSRSDTGMSDCDGKVNENHCRWAKQSDFQDRISPRYLQENEFVGSFEPQILWKINKCKKHWAGKYTQHSNPNKSAEIWRFGDSMCIWYCPKSTSYVLHIIASWVKYMINMIEPRKCLAWAVAWP